MATAQITEDTDLAAVYPYTCEWCSNSPATHMAVYDYRNQNGVTNRRKAMLCGRCAHGVTLLPDSIATWLLFRLMLDGEGEDVCEAAIERAVQGMPEPGAEGSG